MRVQDFKKYNLPDKPGVYFFKKGIDILYIGKATSLKSRVRSYFSDDLIQTRGPLITDMVFKANALRWQETDNVLEALILEANLIKKYQPIANTKEKDDKSFNYVCISNDALPKVLTVRGKNLEKNKYKNVFGPFTNGGQLKEGLRIIRKIFPFIDDKTKNYNEFYQQLNLAPNPEERKKYFNNIKNIEMFFEGKKMGVLKNLEKQMKNLAKEQKFEEANIVKKQIFALKHINDVSLIKEEKTLEARPKEFRLEAYDIAHMSGKNMVGVMTVLENNTVNKDEYRKFKIRTQGDANDSGALLEVLERRFTHTQWRYPNLVVVDGNTIQINVANKFLQKIGLDIKVVGVVKDERHKPKGILGDKELAKKYEREILLANSEAHRFAITFHKKIRNKNFLPV